MRISLPDQFPATDLAEEMSFVVHALVEQGVTSVADVRIVLRAFNEDGEEYYPADASGVHDMGFELKRKPVGSDYDAISTREISWQLARVKRQPAELGELRGLRALLGERSTPDE